MKIMAIFDAPSDLPLSVSTHAANHHKVRLVRSASTSTSIEASQVELHQQ